MVHTRRGWKGKWGLAVLVGMGLAAYYLYTEVRPVVIFGLRDDYAHAIPYQNLPMGLESLSAEACGGCHREIYEEWKTSFHAKAYADPFFQAYWKKDDNIWVCLNCHTPLENQQPTLIESIPNDRVEQAVQVENPRYDAAFQQEGVTCAVCHVRNGVVYGPFDDSVAPHPTEFDPAFRTTKICYRCHNVVSGPLQFYNVGPCGTYPEYEGEFFMKEQGMICQSCHMPEVNRPVAEGGPLRQGRRHLWRGGHDPDMIKQALAIHIQADPPALGPGDTVTFTVTLINSGAGHKLPTGDPDRHFTVEFAVKDRENHVLQDKTETMGRWILWQPVILELYDNRLLPLASQDYEFSYDVPEDRKDLLVEVKVQYHILTDDQHLMLREKYELQGDDPYRFTIYERTFPLSADLAQVLEAQMIDPHIGCAKSRKETGSPVFHSHLG